MASSKRELIEPTKGDKRYVRRSAGGQFKEVDDVSRSLSADARRKAKTVVKKGQGDKGDARPSASKSGAKKSTAKKSSAKKSSPKKSSAKTSTAKKSSARKSSGSKRASSKSKR